MILGKNRLNAYAATYIPISKNSDGDNKAAEKVIGVSEKTEDVVEAVGCPIPDDYFPEQSLVKQHVSDKSYSDRIPIHEDTSVAENQSVMYDIQTAIDFLMIEFSGYSEQSIADLLDFCNGDVAATLDMMEQLELFTQNEPSEIPGTSEVQHGEGSAPQNIKSSGYVSSS